MLRLPLSPDITDHGAAGARAIFRQFFRGIHAVKKICKFLLTSLWRTRDYAPESKTRAQNSEIRNQKPENTMKSIHLNPPQSTSIPDAHPRSDRFRCGGRESKFLAGGRFMAAVVACGMALAPNFVSTASAVVVTNVPFTGDASALLDLDPTRTLAAVNFYDSGQAGSNFTVGTIQGVEFFDYDLHLTHAPGGALDNTPFNIGTGVHAGSGFTLTYNHPHEGDPARWFSSADPLSTARTQIGTFTPSADNTQAERWAQVGVYRQNASPTVDTWELDFGVGNANKDVEINMLGGGIWNIATTAPTTHWTRQTVSVDGVDKAIFDDLGFNMYLATFPAQLDSNGQLDIVLTRSLMGGSSNWRYNLNSGFTVTEVVPEPSSMILLGAGMLGLLARRRRA